MTARHTAQTKTEPVVHCDPPRYLRALYGATVLAFLGASFVPESRLWGVAIWGYLPVWSRILLALVALIPLLLHLLGLERKNGSAELDRPASDRSYLLAVAGFTIGAGILFYLLRARTFFLGDGYTALANLASESPIMKGRELGESLSHLWVAKLLGGFNEANALLSYQGISIATGVLLVLATGVTARYLFSELRQRLLFVAGTISGGYMLLYFGYVENYSLFVLSAVCLLLIGLLALQGHIPRWVALVFCGLAIFCHIFGLFFLPATLYVLIAGTSFERRLERLSVGSIVVLLVLLGLAGVASLWAVAQANFFVRIALLTPIPTRFTIEGYTLFSPAHLADFANLLLLIFPGIPVLFGMLLWKPVRARLKLPSVRFLLVAGFSVVAGLFLFDPKLGMPRDWDLFSVVAVPLVLLCLVLLIDRRSPLGRAGLLAGGLVLLNLVVLAGRAVVLAEPERSLQQIEDYVALDPNKGKHAIKYLVTYHERQGNEAEQFRWEARWEQYADERLLHQADTLLLRGQLSQAIPVLEQIITENPMSAPAYTYLGSTYLRLRQCRQAIEALEMARGLSPHNMRVEIGLGYAHYCVGEKRKAEASFERAIVLAPMSAEPYFNFAQFYKQERNVTKYADYLTRALRQTDATGPMFGELGAYCVSIGQFQKAAAAYQQGLQRGLDTAAVLDQVRAHPELSHYIK